MGEEAGGVRPDMAPAEAGAAGEDKKVDLSVVRYKHLSLDAIIEEVIFCDRKFYFAHSERSLDQLF